MERKAYPSDISGEEVALVAPYLTLMTEDAPQRDFPLREVFNDLRYIVRTGASWPWMPHGLPPWQVAYQQSGALDQSRRLRVFALKQFPPERLDRIKSSDRISMKYFSDFYITDWRVSRQR